MRLLVAGSLFLCATAAASAAAEAATAVESEDSIAAAKRDFETLREARDRTLQVKGEGPRLTVPELQTAAPAPRTPRRSPREEQEELLRKKKSANWLVEAMEKTPGTRSTQGRRAPEKPEDLPGSAANPMAETGLPASHPVEADAPAANDRIEAPPPNPLAPFLEGWMSPQDYALLKPGLQPASDTAGSPGIGSSGAQAGFVGSATEPLSGSSLMTGTERPGFTGPTRPPENPYLPGLTDGPSPLSGFSPPVQPVAAAIAPLAPVIHSAPSTAPVPPPASKVPDFVRATRDEQYFKPLKRF